MKLNERVAIITEENIRRLSRLYGEINIDDLSRIVNNHLKVAIDEIEEDSIRKEYGNSDVIQMKSDIVLTDKEGKVIDVKTPRPEYMPEIFLWKFKRFHLRPFGRKQTL